MGFYKVRITTYSCPKCKHTIKKERGYGDVYGEKYGRCPNCGYIYNTGKKLYSDLSDKELEERKNRIKETYKILIPIFLISLIVTIITGWELVGVVAVLSGFLIVGSFFDDLSDKRKTLKNVSKRDKELYDLEVKQSENIQRSNNSCITRNSTEQYAPQSPSVMAEKPVVEKHSNSSPQLKFENTKKSDNQTFLAQDLAGVIAEKCLNELSEVMDICSKYSVSYDYKNLVISTFAYYYVIWLFNFENIIVRQSEIVEEVYKEKFSLFNRSRFDDEPFKDVLQNETTFAEKLIAVDKRVRKSYHENGHIFVDDGVSDEYILEFINDENDKDKIKIDIVIKIIRDWASKAKLAGKQIKIID